jgi:hypothetical protein
MCSSKVKRGVVVWTSQMLHRLSFPPEASWEPSADHFRPQISWQWFSNVAVRWFYDSKQP